VNTLGVSPDRVEFIPFLPTAKYMELHNRIDIALDPFPYAGGTTTCDALWMGVPIVTLAGQTAVGRGGVSILHNTGLAELIANSTEEYLHIATMLAQDIDRLTSVRVTLREQMRTSPLMNRNRFAEEVESAYRAMWRNWCSSAATR
jgi:protein O-GlcNAc transferase